MARERDFAYEALALVTGADQTAHRGELNKALQLIKQQSDITDSVQLAQQIHERSRQYRAAYPEIALTPPALAKHWTRVEKEATRQTGTNLANAKSDDCPMCEGDRMVVVATRAPLTTEWMVKRNIKASETHMIEEFAPCPQCNSTEVVFRRYDGTVLRTPDQAKTRELMSR